MKRVTRLVLILLLCGFAGLAISSCKKKGPKIVSAEIATDTIDVRTLAEKTIKNKIRRNNVLMLLDDIDRAREEAALVFLDLQRKVQNNPAISREDYDAVLQELALSRANVLRKIASARMTMRTYVTKAEWQTLFTKEKKKKEDPTGLDRYRAKRKAKTAANGNPDEAAETTTPNKNPGPAESEVSP